MTLKPHRVRKLVDYPKRTFKLGDTVATVVKPIAKVLGMEDCGGCKKRQEKLNELGDKIVNKF